MLKDDRIYAKLWGREPVGLRMEISMPFVCKQCFLDICAFILDKGIIISDVAEGSFDCDTFIDFLCHDQVSSFASGRTF
jgi:hypothetical protein